MENNIIVIVGQTAVGKTDISIKLAKLINGEIINGDAMQVYKGLDILTAKVKEEEKEGVIHHLLSFKNIEDNYRVEEYQSLVREKIEDILKRNKTPILVGGTGLYISHKDLFKIGELILHKGNFNGKQIISQKYIEEMCSAQIDTPYAVKPERVLPKIGVGYIMNISRDGYIFKDGTNGQYVIINFDKNLLISILSSEKEMKYVQKY